MKDKLTGLVIICLVGVVWFQRGCDGNGVYKGPDTLVVHDTSWKTHEKTIVKQVPISKEILVPYEVLVTKYQADTNYYKLKLQYEELAKQYAAKRVYNDTVAIGEYGNIKIIDTVSENKLGKRTVQEDYKIPEVTKTVTITKYPNPKRQVYVGGGINASSISNVTGVEAGILYKSKKDQIYGGKVTVDNTGSVGFGISSYWKIQTKK